MSAKPIVWLMRCPTRPGYTTHWKVIRAVPGGGREARCSFCDRNEGELKALHDA